MKDFDNSFLSDEVRIIAGVDEAGRGPLAGPVVAAAVLFDSESFINNVNDSKKLSAEIRSALYPEIFKRALSVGIGVVSNEIIDNINILNATMLAMKRAVNKLTLQPDLILVDGNRKFPSQNRQLTVIKGDCRSFAVAAASIVAKVYRDDIMKQASLCYPEYGWERNKGYATKFHIEAIKRHGLTPIHRRTFTKGISCEFT